MPFADLERRHLGAPVVGVAQHPRAGRDVDPGRQHPLFPAGTGRHPDLVVRTDDGVRVGVAGVVHDPDLPGHCSPPRHTAAVAPSKYRSTDRRAGLVADPLQVGHPARQVVQHLARRPVFERRPGSGSFKPGRENGLSAVSAKILDDGKIIQGFNKYMNKNPKILLLANGVANNTDSYTHDPNGYYVQVYIDVMDSGYHGYLPGKLHAVQPGNERHKSPTRRCCR